MRIDIKRFKKIHIQPPLPLTSTKFLLEDQSIWIFQYPSKFQNSWLLSEFLTSFNTNWKLDAQHSTLQETALFYVFNYQNKPDTWFQYSTAWIGLHLSIHEFIEVLNPKPTISHGQWRTQDFHLRPNQVVRFWRQTQDFMWVLEADPKFSYGLWKRTQAWQGRLAPKANM